MRHRNNLFRPSWAVRRSSNRNERGVALVTTLLLLALLTAMSLTMVLSVSSDMLINGYYGNSRSSFYAADSGANIARQAMVAGIVAVVPANFSTTTQPIPTTTAGNVQSNITATYGAFQSLNTGNAAHSWPQKFSITFGPGQGLTQGSCTVQGGGGTCAAPTGAVTGYTYVYNYSYNSIGQSQGAEAATLVDGGQLKIVVAPGAAPPSKQAFSAWGMFIDQYALCGGGTLVPGLITGPVFTNGAWNFGSGGSGYEFTDKVGSVNSQAGYVNGSCQASSALSANGITPKFDAGFAMGQPAVPLPTDSFNQKGAVLDSMGTSGAPTQAQMTSTLKDAAGHAYPSSGTPSTGVFLPVTVDPVSGARSFTGGGILVEGDAQVTLSLPTTGNTTAQIYTIVQGGVTTTITVDPAAGSAGTTTISSTLGTQTITGVPVQKDPSTGAVTRDATMLYVDGSITALKGPGSGQPGIQDDTALTITAAKDVTITGDVLYKTEPVTTGGTTPDTLIAGNDHGQVLGIFTASGNVNLANTQSSGNLEIDASVATISQGGSGGIVNTGAGINTLKIVGGRIQNTIQNINSTTRNVYFDRRFANNGFAPPWFPSTTVTTTGPPTAVATPTVNRTQWRYMSAYN
jgi:Tfp pilus assembly protein PilX